MKWFHILIKKDYIWIWKAIDHNTRKLIGWECGDRSPQTLTKFLDRLNLWWAKRIYSDFMCVTLTWWEVSACVRENRTLTK